MKGNTMDITDMINLFRGMREYAEENEGTWSDETKKMYRAVMLVIFYKIKQEIEALAEF